MSNYPQSITLSNFEQIIDSRILERGFEYFKNDHILSIEQIDKGIWEAIVSGSENYEVAVNLRDSIIIKSSCNCPFDLGNYCKHEVAIFNFLKYSDLAKGPASNKMQKIEAILNGFSIDELRDNFMDILRHHRNVRTEFLDDYSEDE